MRRRRILWRGGGAPAPEIAKWYLGPWPAPYDAIEPIVPAAVRVVYQPKPALSSIWPNPLAVDLASSLLNIANPGSDNATAPVPPTWSSAHGWSGSGSQYTVAGSILQESQNETLLATYTATLGEYSRVTPFQTSVSDIPRTRFQIHREDIGIMNVYVANYGGSDEWWLTSNTYGIVGVSGNRAYINGVDLELALSAAAGPMTDTIKMLQGTASIYLAAFVWYAPAVTLSQLQAVSAAMEVIRAAS